MLEVAGCASSDSGISRVWMFEMSSRPSALGGPMKISRSKRPGRRKATSIASTRLVVPITMTPSTFISPSISDKSCVTIRTSDCAPDFSRCGAIASSSSINTIEGAWCAASAKILRRFASVSPYMVPTTSGPLM